MPLISTAACDEEFIALITGPVDLTLVFSKIFRISTSGSVEEMKSPISNKTTIIDHIVENPDRVSITGILGCKGCGEVTSPIGIIKLFKDGTSAQIYTPDDLFTITTNRAQYEKMILKSWRIVENVRTQQFMNIQTNWVGANIAGDIEVPSFDAGGITG